MQEFTPLAIGLSALVVLAVAIWSWQQNRKLSREQAAVSLILKWDAAHRDDLRALWLLLQKGIPAEQLADHTPVGRDRQGWKAAISIDNLPAEQQQYVIAVRCLNYFEAIAIAIQRGAIDEKTVREFLGPNLVYYVEKLYPFITALRVQKEVGDEDTYRFLVRLARRWGAFGGD